MRWQQLLDGYPVAAALSTDKTQEDLLEPEDNPFTPPPQNDKEEYEQELEAATHFEHAASISSVEMPVIQQQYSNISQEVF